MSRAAEPFIYPCHTVRFLLLGNSVPEVNDQLGIDHTPVLPPACPFLRNVHHGQIEHLEKTVIRRKDGFGFGYFSELAVKAFDGVGGID